MSLSAHTQSRRHLNLLFVACAAMTACGGGGSGADAPPPPAGSPPPPAAALTLADCESKPAGLVNTYLNSTRPRREWLAATFEGESVIARREYDTAGAIVQTRYYKDDAAAKTSALVGREWFDATGTVTRRIKLTGSTLSTALTVGQSQTVNYTWQVLVPSGEPDGAESLTQTYDGNEAITLGSGRLETCKTTITISNGGTQTSRETVHLAPGSHFVKSYFQSTAPLATDVGQTYLTELATTTATQSFSAAAATTAPTLGECSALPAGLDLRLTASGTTEAASARRSTANAVVLATNSIAMQRRHASTDALQSTSHFDPTIGFLLQLGREEASGTTGTVYSGIPDLRATASGASVDYTQTNTPYPSGATTTSADRFTFLGHEKVSTPAGTFDTCKVRYNYSSGLAETYWLLPDRFYVRLESVSATGTKSTREQLAPAP